MHTPLGMSVSVSVSPLVEYPGGGPGYASGTYGQHQFGQHSVPLQTTTPHGLSMTPSMPPFTLLPSVMPSGSHVTPTGTSARVSSGSVPSSGGHRHARTRSKSHARRLEMDGELASVGGNEDESIRNNAKSNRGSPGSPPPSSSARQRHSHHQQHHHQPTQVREIFIVL